MQARPSKTPALLLALLLTATGLVPLIPGVGAALPSGCALGITELHWLDLDHNGHLDAVRVVAEANPVGPVVNENTVYPGDFDFGGGRRGTGIDMGTAGDNTFFLFFPESATLDGGWTTTTPTFTYAGVPDGKVHIRDNAAGPVQAATCFSNGSTVANVDEAPPVLKAAYAAPGGSTVTVVFSEPVGKACATPPCTAAPAALTAGDFCVQNAAHGAALGISSVAPTTAPAQAWTLTLAAPLASGGADTNVGQFASGGTALTGQLWVTGSCATGTQAFMDASTLPTVTPAAQHDLGVAPAMGLAPAVTNGAVPLGAPFLVHVHASVSDTQLVAEFNGPVATTGNAAITSTSAFSVDTSPGGGPWAVSAVSHSVAGLGSERVLVTSSVILPDLTNKLFTNPGAIAGAGTLITAPQASWALQDNSFLSRPRIVAMTTVDGDLNGCIDAVKVTFNENVNDASIVGVGGWSLYWPIDNTLVTATVITGDTGASGLAQHTVADATAAAAGATTLTSAANGFLPADVGRPVAGTGIAGATTIVTVAAGGGSATINIPTTAAVSSATMGLPNMILYSPSTMTPSSVNDKTVFVTMPGVVGINTPGNLACHGTGATDASGNTILPRVSYTPPAGVPATDRATAANPLIAGLYPTVCTGLSAPMCASSTAPASPVPGQPLMYRDTATDGAAPVALSIATRDCMVQTCTPNGKLDGIQVTFSEPVTDASFRASDWQVQATALCTTSGTAPGIYTITGTSNNGTANGAVHGLVLAEGSTFDTGCIPDVTYSGTSTVDAAGLPLATIQRGPRLSAITPTASMSGPVGSPPKVIMGIGGAAGAMYLKGLAYPVDYLAAGVTVGTTFQVTSGSGAGTYTVCGTSSTPNCANPTTTFLNYIVDPGAATGGGSQILFLGANEVDGAGPVLTQLLGTVGSNNAQAVFSEKPCGGSGTPPSCPDLQSTAFQYVDTASGGASGITGVARAMPTDALPNKNNKVNLTLSAPLASADVSGGDCLRLIAPATEGVVGSGIALTDVGPGATSNPASGYNNPYPRAASTGCISFASGTGPKVTSAITIDSNLDGYLDAIQVTLTAPIRDGTQLLRHDGGSGPSSDTIYFDADKSGTVTNNDYRFNAFGATVAGTVACPANPDCLTPLATNYNLLWADLGAAGPGAGDAVWIDVDSSSAGNNVVSNGDFRVLTAPSLPGGVVTCSPSRDPDCGRTYMAHYTDTDRNGYVSAGDVRLTALPALPAGAVSCPANNSPEPDGDCGAGLTPTTFNLATTDPSNGNSVFSLGVIGANNVPPIVTCVLTGKGAGPVLGGATSSCQTGVAGVASPLGGAAPGATDSCSGALGANAPNDNVFYVCFTPWRSPDNPPTDPSMPIPNTGFLPTLTYTPAATPTLKALNGAVPVGGFTTGLDLVPATTDGARPVLAKVYVQGGSKSAKLVFSEPIGAEASGIGSSSLSATDLAYINGNAGTAYCRSGVDAIASLGTLPAATALGGSLGFALFNVTVNFQGNLSHEDIVGCVQNPPPASTTASRDGIRAIPTLMERGSNRAVDSKIVPYTDSDKPRIDTVSFIDANGDGTLDVVRITFTEPVNDCFGTVGSNTAQLRAPATFPLGPVNCATVAAGHGSSTTTDPTHEYGWPTHMNDFVFKVGTQTLAPKFAVTGQTGAAGERCLAHYNTAAMPAGFAGGATEWMKPLVLYPGDAAPTIGPFDGFNDNTVYICLDPDSTSTSAGQGTLDLGTGAVGTFTYTPDSTMACTPANQANRPICDIADIGPDAGFLSPVANLMLATTGTITDAARPVVLSATTDDRDHNGKVDSVKISFSENIKPSSFTQSDWNVEGHPLKGIDVAPGPLCSSTSSVTSGLTRFWLCFDEVAGASTYDTDMGHAANSGPRVTYVGGGSLVDLAPRLNRLRAFDAPAKDGAQPVVVRLQATAGSATVTLTFSEPVDGTGNNEQPPTLSITYNDLYYEEHAGTGGSATGFGNNQVVHSPGDRAAALTLNAPVSQFDFDNDKVCFVTGAVKEHGAAPALPLVNNCVGLNGVIGDLTPPGEITDLHIDRTRTTGTSLVLEWTTPGDNDLASFQLYACVCSLAGKLAQEIKNLAAPVSAAAPAPIKGTVQRITLTPPTSLVNYTMLTLDASGNPSKSNVLTLAALDTAAPEAVGDLTVATESTTGGDRVTLSWTAVHDDAGDASSGKVARYVIYKLVGSQSLAAADLKASNVAAATFDPSPLASPGSAQRATVTGLTAGTTYTFVVIAIDDQDNASPLTGSAQKQATPVKGTGSNGPGAIADLTAADGTPAASAVLLTWTVPAGTPTSYLVHAAPAADVNLGAAANVVPATRLQFSPVGMAASGATQQLTVSGLDDGTDYSFSVIAVDATQLQGAVSNIATHKTAVDPNAISNATIRQRNLDIEVKVTYANGTGSTINWTLPAEDTAHPTLGVQIWKCTSKATSSCVLFASLSSDTVEFQAHSYTDATGTASDRYLVTSYYGSTPGKGYARSSADASAIPGFADLSPSGAGDAGSAPSWLWWLLLGAVLLLVAGLIIWAVMRKRPESEAATAAPSEEGEAWPAEEAADVAAGGAPPGEGMEAAAPGEAPAEAPAGPPSKAQGHFITCPKCSTQFSATGEKPLAIQCPNCGVRGILR